jgi:3-deoxy-D-manno-octulosonic acid kinase
VNEGRETVARTERGAMLYDASCLGQARTEVFDAGFWRARGAIEELAGGRGSVAFVRAEAGRWVLRHYRRGGLVAKFMNDRYLWLGEDATRSFREWRLLRELRALQLPVPRPVAARFERSGLTYRADLVTEELPTRLTLARAIAEDVLPGPRWKAVGACIGAFHGHGVRHADLNAHNILLGSGETVYLVDFDRGCIRRRGSWEERVLVRLRRSLDKVSVRLPPGRFGTTQWNELLEGYGRPPAR